MSTITKHTQRIQDFLNTGKSSYIYKTHTKNIVFKNKAFKIASNPKYNGYERGLAKIIYKFFDKKCKGSGLKNQQLADELHKPIIRKFKKRKVYSSFKDNI